MSKVLHTVHSTGLQFWVVEGDLHRIDGPAVVYPNGRQFWYLNHSRYYNNTTFQKAAKLADEEMSFLIIKYGDVK